MNTILPVVVVLSLGAGFGLILRRWLPNIWITSIAAGILGTVMWGIIMEILFRMVDFEEERGETLYHVIFIVFLVTSLAALVALTLRSMANNHANTPSQEAS
jgi:hypothetical protein